MFSFVMIVVPASASLSVKTGHNGGKLLVVEPLGIRLWGRPALELVRLRRAGQDAVLIGYLRPVVAQNGQVFPAVTITDVRPAKQPVQEGDELEAILGRSAPIQANGRHEKTLAEALSD